MSQLITISEYRTLFLVCAVSAETVHPVLKRGNEKVFVIWRKNDDQKVKPLSKHQLIGGISW